MYNLILDTSHTHTIIILSNKGQTIDYLTYPHQNKLSSLLLLSIQSFLKKHDLSPSNLKYLSVGVGPGSYTGTRVAVAVAKSMSFALDLPLLPFCSALAYIPRSITKNVLFLMESKQGFPFYMLTDGKTKCSIGSVTNQDQMSILSLDATLICHDPASFLKNHPSFSETHLISAFFNPEALCVFLQNEIENHKLLASSELDKLHLNYLNNFFLPSITTESLGVQQPLCI